MERDGNFIGNGYIVKSKDATYIFTAKHCIYNDLDNTKKEFLVKDLDNNILEIEDEILFSEEEDIAIIQLDDLEYPNILFGEVPDDISKILLDGI